MQTRDDLLKLLFRVHRLYKAQDPGWYLTRSPEPRNSAINVMNEIQDILKVEIADKKSVLRDGGIEAVDSRPVDETPDTLSHENNVMLSPGTHAIETDSSFKAPLAMPETRTAKRRGRPPGSKNNASDRPATAGKALSRVAPSGKSLLDVFKANPGVLLGRSDILAQIRLSQADWTEQINQLLKDGAVIRTGQKKGTKYQLA